MGVNESDCRLACMCVGFNMVDWVEYGGLSWVAGERKGVVYKFLVKYEVGGRVRLEGWVGNEYRVFQVSLEPFRFRGKVGIASGKRKKQRSLSAAFLSAEQLNLFPGAGGVAVRPGPRRVRDLF